MITVSVNPCEDFAVDAAGCKDVQEAILQLVLKVSAPTSFGSEVGVVAGMGVEKFRSQVRLTTYNDYETEVEKIYQGDDVHAMTAEDPTSVMLSCGSTGSPKMLPRSALMMQHSMGLFSLSDAFLRAAAPLPSGPARSLTFQSVGEISTTPSGLTMASSTSGAISTKAFENFLRTTQHGSAPYNVYMHEQHFEAVYCHWICALARRKEIVKVQGNYAYELLEGFQVLEGEWKGMVRDLRNGRLGKGSVGKGAVKDAVDEIVQGMELGDADEIEAELKKGMKGVLKRLFPRLAHCCCISTGLAARNTAAVRFYLGEETPVVSGMYGSVEGILGVNTAPLEEDVRYTMLPRAAFYEFIPIKDAHMEQPGTKLMWELEAGDQYLPVITTFGGLCRYRMDDVLEVEGFFPGSQCPRMKYAGSLSNTVDLSGEALPDVIVIDAVADAVDAVLWDEGSSLAEFTTTVVANCTPPRLVRGEIAKTQFGLTD
mmetsp:Transcript_53398/g.169792  ORF Transcript_53398/g.169792 Transcript_53398/m.169792 type:complete len:484 (+) Transcript_53398:487-1938(+)